MSMSKHVLAAAVAVWMAAAGLIDRPGLAQGPSTGRIVWRGEMRHRVTRSAGGKVGRAENVVNFETVQEVDPDGNLRDASHTLNWDLSGVASLADAVVVDRPMAGRRRGDWSSTCLGQGRAVRLGDSPEERARFDGQLTAGKTRCVDSPAEGVFGTFGPGTWSSAPRNFGPVPWEELRDRCEFATRSRYYADGALHEETVRITVSAPVPAVMTVSRRAEDAYAQFVPKPGATLTFTASVPAGTARFRFELDRDATSRFPGYATNADIDSAFFLRYDVVSQEGQYNNDGPDVIFDRFHFLNQQEWARVEPLAVETAQPQSAATVTVTTMDYGAVSRLRAFVKSEACGDWQPVPVKSQSDTREFIAIPMDEDDNLMADALEDYRGRASGVDDDVEPRGNGTAGDGLTAFEEYRGFLTSDGDCFNPFVDRHVRTKPKVKDVFVHTPDPEFEMALPHFAWSSGLDVHPICEAQYSGNPQIDWDSESGRQAGDLGTQSTDRKRVVNFTLQFAQLRAWRGHALTQDVPQHGLYMVGRPIYSAAGLTCADDPPNCSGTRLGPPMKTSVIIVDKSDAIGLRRVEIPTHELGHGVGMPHHGWKVVNGVGDVIRANQKADQETPNVVPPGANCVDPGDQPAPADFVGVYYRGVFVGCGAGEIIVQNGENSGNAECPMRYSFGKDFREAPGTRSAYVFSKADEVLRDNQRRPMIRLGAPRPIRLYRGRFLKYDNSLDNVALGRFCLVNTGTGLNGYPGDKNQAGNSQVACMDQLVVNDNVLRGIQ